MFDVRPFQIGGLIAGSIRLSLPPIPDQPSTGFSVVPIVARRVQRRAVEGYWKLLSRLLILQGTEVVLVSIDYDADEGCCSMQFQTPDPHVVASIHEAATVVALSPSDLIGFDSDDRIKDWLRRIEIHLVASLRKLGRHQSRRV